LYPEGSQLFSSGTAHAQVCRGCPISRLWNYVWVGWPDQVAVRAAVAAAEGCTPSAAWLAAKTGKPSRQAPHGDGGSEGALWAAAATAVVGAPVELWDVLFDAPFLTRARSLTASALDGLGLAALTDRELAAAAAAAAAAVAGAEGGTDGGHTTASAAGHTRGGTAGGMGAVAAAGWERLVDSRGRSKARKARRGTEDDLPGEIEKFSPGVGVVHRHLHSQLQLTLTQVVRLRNAVPAGAARERRASALEPWLQQCTHTALLAAAEALRASLRRETAVTEGNEAGDGESVVVAALLLARVATVLADHSSVVSVVLGSPAGWDAAAHNGSVGDAAGTVFLLVSRHLLELGAKIPVELTRRSDYATKCDPEQCGRGTETRQMRTLPRCARGCSSARRCRRV
jgi:hypothetical protein